MNIPHLTQTDRSEFYPLIREALRGAENQFPVTVSLGKGCCACEFLQDHCNEPEVLARLLKLSAERAAEERQAAIAMLGRGPASESTEKPRAKKFSGAAPSQRHLIAPAAGRFVYRERFTVTPNLHASLKK